ncbi:hypothetical protein HYC85_021538 [Camellia sinensis]|uniref:Rnh202 triple barrel domain-containing protein n=1 Tax=Camellia sinensis TaxID=4442 RepID=A0A7J7GKE9_CAMSI|nr:hypothetical protein HYC85_021538 [Camellia sinensis]
MAWWEGVDETRLLIAPEPSATGNCVGQLLSLRHPKSGNKTCYLLINEALQEIHWFKQSYGSWFVGDYVCEGKHNSLPICCFTQFFFFFDNKYIISTDGCLYTATPVDPVFILLPIFEEARMKKGDDPGKFRQLEEIIFINGYPGYQYLFSIAEKSMQVVCDIKVEAGLRTGRKGVLIADLPRSYPSSRAETTPVNQLKRTLPTLDKNYAARVEKDTLADAVLVLGDYLKDEPWLKLLCSYLKLDLEAATKAPDIEILPTTTENNPASFDPVKEKSESDKKTTRSGGRQTKKAKVETDSRNIKEMFSRATRRKG